MPTVRPKNDTAMAIKRYQEGTAGAGERWKEGVLNPRRDAKTEAQKAKGRYKASMQAVLSEDRWGHAIDAMDPNAIDNAVNALGGSVYEQGVAAKMPKAQPKIEAALKETFAVADSVRNLPGDTVEQRAERAKQFAIRRAKGKK